MKSIKLGLPILLALITVVTACSAKSDDPGSIVGAWEFVAPGGSEQRGLLIFTEGHYSMMFGRGLEARQTYPEDRRMDDAETVVAYNSITANSGTYTVEGDLVTITAFVANDPNLMAAWPNNTEDITLMVEGNEMTWVDPGYIGLDETMILKRTE